jgi:hypothetical protein
VPPFSDSAEKDTNEIHVDYGDIIKTVPCTPGTIVPIPCPSAPGGVLHILEDSL